MGDTLVFIHQNPALFPYFSGLSSGSKRLTFCQSNLRRLFGLLAFIVLPVTSNFAQNQPSYSVGTIAIHPHQVFDTLSQQDNNFLGRFLNSLHILTRENVIRRELLLKEGDACSLPLLQESERNLRRKGIIADPQVTLDTVQYLRIDIDIVTEDKWTIGAAASFKEEAGIRSAGLSLSDDNTTASVGYMHREYFRDTFINNSGRAEDVSVGYSTNLIVGKNFFRSQEYSVPLYVQITVQHSGLITNRGYFYQDLSFLSFTEGSYLQDAAIQSKILQYVHLNSFQTLAMRMALVYGYHWSLSRTAYLGGTTGLRGFGPFDFAGQRSVLMNLEDRIFTPVQLWFFKLGSVIFYDCGTA
jgi:hypothetical protein